MLKIKGNEIQEPRIMGSFDRKAVLFQNHIVAALKKIGVDRDHVEVNLAGTAHKKLPASVSWYYNGRNLKYTYSQMNKFVENLFVIDKVLNLEVEKLVDGEITADQFCREFQEDDDLGDQLTEARKTLEVAEDEKDFDVIAKSYKKLAKKYHPDMSEGNPEMFKKINAAHKLIKKELM